MTLCEALLFLDGWRIANSSDDGKTEAPTDEEFEAALAQSAKRKLHVRD